jgi:hypothetical protein
MLYFGTLLYVSVLLVNALAVLNEERFLARSSYYHISHIYLCLTHPLQFLQSAGALLKRKLLPPLTTNLTHKATIRWGMGDSRTST